MIFSFLGQKAVSMKTQKKDSAIAPVNTGKEKIMPALRIMESKE